MRGSFSICVIRIQHLQDSRLSAGFVVVLGCVETKNVLSLSRAGVDRSQMLPALHFPDCRHYSIFLDCVVSDLFGARRGRRFVVGHGALADCAFILRHTNSKILQSACGRFLMCGELLHTLVASVQPIWSGDSFGVRRPGAALLSMVRDRIPKRRQAAALQRSRPHPGSLTRSSEPIPLLCAERPRPSLAARPQHQQRAPQSR